MYSYVLAVRNSSASGDPLIEEWSDAVRLSRINCVNAWSDFIPFTGFLDDFTIIMFISGAFQQDIEAFLEWEDTRR